MNTLKISIVIPIYNMQNFLKRCLDSVLQNEYNNLEIILINDGSTDDSEAICFSYKDKDPRFVYIKKENGGLSFARNVGLDNATGDFIVFLDSDDWLAPNALDVLIKTAQETNAKIIEYRAKITNNTQEETQTKKHHKETNKSALLRIYKNRHFGVWNRMVHKSLLQQLRFVEGQIYEDVLFTTKLLNNVDEIVYLDQFLYFYFFENTTSLVRGNYSLKQLDHIKSIEQTLQFALENKIDNDLLKAIYKHYETICVNNYISLTQNSALDKTHILKKEIKNKISHSKVKHIKNAKLIANFPVWLTSLYFAFRKKGF
jgi:glycosyltransferase involved in cell wall biosynthesis